ncbi:hypothetical protein vseg_006160 [Gypsophila vaccaria]
MAQEVATQAQEVVLNQLQNGALATLTNRTVANMQLINSISWSGQFTALPATIASYAGVARIETVRGDQGSSAAVTYTITGAGGAAYAIILAWDAPSIYDPVISPNKVLGLMGSKSVIDDLTWDHVRAQLNSATIGSSFAVAIPGSRLSMSGRITNNITTNMQWTLKDKK